MNWHLKLHKLRVLRENKHVHADHIHDDGAFAYLHHIRGVEVYFIKVFTIYNIKNLEICKQKICCNKEYTCK